MADSREVPEALRQIEIEELTLLEAFAAKLLVAACQLERDRLANGEKPLHALSVAEIIDIVRSGAEAMPMNWDVCIAPESGR